MNILDTLVKLANLGSSGISIFAIFWCGWLIARPAASKDTDRQKTLRIFMLFCVTIFIISVVAGIWNGYIGEQNNVVKIKKLHEIIAKYKDQNKLYRVAGVLKKDDDSDPGDINITTQYPLMIPDHEGKIIGLSVSRNAQGHFPKLGFSCPGYGTRGLDLNEFAIRQNDVIDISTVILHKLPVN